jgi:endo-beta-N-acetylglucosaminidase D
MSNITIHKSDTKTEMQKKIAQMKKKKKNLKKYMGILSGKIDPLSHQKEIRNEWV